MYLSAYSTLQNLTQVHYSGLHLHEERVTCYQLNWSSWCGEQRVTGDYFLGVILKGVMCPVDCLLENYVI